MEICKNGNIYFIPRIEKETEQQLINRGWLIANQKPSNLDEFKKLLNLSELWHYYYYYGCEYNSDIMIKLVEINKKLFC